MIPTLLKFKDLKAAGIVSNWTTLSRWIAKENFPQGIPIGPHTRAWTEQSINEWLAAKNGGVK
jgi:predicted DNA-binding transcriptional regulator AlpA